MLRLLNKRSARDKRNPAFWVTNITNKNVCLRDLALTIPAWTSMNLLDKKHFYYTIEQLEKSSEDGSLYKKSNKIKIRREAPQYVIEPGVQLYKGFIPRKPRSSVKMEEIKYEDLDMSDEEFANQFSGESAIEKEEEKE